MKSKLLRRHLLSILVFGLTLILAFGVIVNVLVARILIGDFESTGLGAARIVADAIDAEVIPVYLETKETDAFYDAVADVLDLFCEDLGFVYAYIAVPEEEGLRGICYSDASAEDALGKLDAYLPGEKEWAQRIMAGDTDGGTIKFKDAVYGDVISAAAPISDADGKAVALVYMEYAYGQVLRKVRAQVVTIQAALAAIMILALLLYARYTHRQFILPIETLNREANSILAHLESREPYISSIHTGDEIEALSKSFENMSRDMIDYIDQNARMSADKQRIITELDMAASIQASQLPGVFPPLTDRREFDIFASMKPARMVGGDFYDFFMVDDDHIALVIADVSDKGIPACMFMMMAKTLLKIQLQAGKRPAEAMAGVNAQLMENNENRQFVTIWAAVLELSTGRGVEANAGHEHPALRRAGGGYELVEYKHSLPLAVMPNTRFRDFEFRLCPGDSLFVYTDGVTEASNADGELFRTSRMLDALDREPDAAPEAVIANVHDGIAAFVGDADQFDDITMLCLRYNGPQKE